MTARRAGQQKYKDGLDGNQGHNKGFVIFS